MQNQSNALDIFGGISTIRKFIQQFIICIVYHQIQCGQFGISDRSISFSNEISIPNVKRQKYS